RDWSSDVCSSDLAIAASTALPPASSTSFPAWVASGWALATRPWPGAGAWAGCFPGRGVAQAASSAQAHAAHAARAHSRPWKRIDTRLPPEVVNAIAGIPRPAHKAYRSALPPGVVLIAAGTTCGYGGP